MTANAKEKGFDTATQAPFSYDIRVTGDISPYTNADDGRTTRVSVKITSNDDLCNILQARQAGGAQRPWSIANPHELLNVDINARVNPFTDEHTPSAAPPASATAESRRPVKTASPAPHSPHPFHRHMHGPQPAMAKCGGSVSHQPLAIAATAAHIDPDEAAMAHLWHRPASARSRTELSEVLERAGPTAPSERSLSPHPSEWELADVLRRTTGPPEAREMSPAPHLDHGRYSRPPSMAQGSVHQARRGGSVVVPSEPLRSSSKIRELEGSEADEAVRDPTWTSAVVPRRRSPPPSLGRRFASLLPPTPEFNRPARSTTPPPVMQAAWLVDNRAGGRATPSERPASVQSNVSLSSILTTTHTSTTTTTTTHTTTQQATLTVPVGVTPSTASSSPSIRPYHPAGEARRGGCADHGPSFAPSSANTSFVGYHDIDRVQMAQMHRTPKHCYEVCYLCSKLITGGDRIVPQDRPIHRGCLRCTECRRLLTVDSLKISDEAFYCEVHHAARDRVLPSALSNPYRSAGHPGGTGGAKPARPQNLTLSFHPHTVAYSQPSASEPSFCGTASSLDLSDNVPCSCDCHCMYCPISLYGVVTESEAGDQAHRCACHCACPVCVRARGIHSSLGTPPPWTPAIERSMMLHPSPSARSTPFPGAPMVGGSVLEPRSDTPYRTLDRSTHSGKACLCQCRCAFCPNALYGQVSVDEEVLAHPCHCDCPCSICVRALNIYDNFGDPPEFAPPRAKTPAGCLNPGENTPCLLFAKAGGGDASVFECPCPNCHETRVRDANLIERIMAYYYSKAVLDPTYSLTPKDKEYIRLICPCCHCRRFRECNYKTTGSPVLKPQAKSASPTPSPSPPQHKEFGKCPCPNCTTGTQGLPSKAPSSPPPPKAPSSPPPPKAPSSPPPKPPSGKPPGGPPKDFGECPCPNCKPSMSGPPPKTPGSPSPLKAPSSPSAPPKSPTGKPPSGPPKDFGQCPCPNCTSGTPGPPSKAPSSPPPPKAPSSPPPKPPSSKPSGGPPKDFGECPCPNCTSGTPGPPPKAPSSPPPPKAPSSPPPKPPSSKPSGGPPKDFGECPCPNCTSGTPGPPPKAPSSPPPPKAPSSPPPKPPSSKPPGGPPKDFGECPCPNCTSGTPRPASPPPPKAPSSPPAPPKSPTGKPPSGSPKDFGQCPCPNCSSNTGPTKSTTSPPAKSPSPPPPKAPSTPPSKPPTDFGTCPCPNCSSNTRPGKPPTSPPPGKSPSSPPPPKAPSGPSKDFGVCPCPNCSSNAGPAKPTTSPPPPKAASPPPTPKPATPAPAPTPKDFGACPCPNCTGQFGTQPPSKPTPTPSSPPPAKSEGKPPTDFGVCPCPNCTTRSTGALASPSPAKPAVKPTSSPPASPSTKPTGDFGACPCPNCTTSMPAPSKPTPASPKPASTKPVTPAKSSSPATHTFDCPCPHCRAYKPPVNVPNKQGGRSTPGGSPRLTPADQTCTCRCACALCSLSPKYDVKIKVSLNPDTLSETMADKPLIVTTETSEIACHCTCACDCCTRAQKFCNPNASPLGPQPTGARQGRTGGGKPQVVTVAQVPANSSSKLKVDVGRDGKPNVIVNGKLEETRKQLKEEFLTRSPRGSEWLTERITDNYMRTVVEERQRRLNPPPSLSASSAAIGGTFMGDRRGGRANAPAYSSPLSISMMAPLPEGAATKQPGSKASDSAVSIVVSAPPPSTPPSPPAVDQSMIMAPTPQLSGHLDTFNGGTFSSSIAFSALAPSPIPLTRRAAIRQRAQTTAAASPIQIDLRSAVSPSPFDPMASQISLASQRRNETANAKNNWEHPICPTCEDFCYMFDKVTFDGVAYHRHCLKCVECKRVLHPTHCVRVRDQLYCSYHASNVLRRRSMLIGPEASRPKPTRRRPPSVTRKSGASSPASSRAPSTVPPSFAAASSPRPTPPVSPGFRGSHFKGPYYNPFGVLNREMASLEQRFRETEEAMRKSFKPRSSTGPSFGGSAAGNGAGNENSPFSMHS